MADSGSLSGDFVLYIHHVGFDVDDHRTLMKNEDGALAGEILVLLDDAPLRDVGGIFPGDQQFVAPAGDRGAVSSD